MPPYLLEELNPSFGNDAEAEALVLAMQKYRKEGREPPRSAGEGDSNNLLLSPSFRTSIGWQPHLQLLQMHGKATRVAA